MQLLQPHTKSLGAFDVHRLLPASLQKMVGPFIFFDHIGPAELVQGVGMNVRPHPHIGLATVTYLFEGAGLHRDSLGSIQRIVPGDVNWMTAGRGIVHSERTAPQDMVPGARLHGIQIWIALPQADEEGDPSFHHHPAASLPTVQMSGVQARVILGEAFGARSPVRTYSDTMYVELLLEAGAQLRIPATQLERALYPVSGQVTLDGTAIPSMHMAVLAEDAVVTIAAQGAARVMLLGGAPIDGERFIWWNFVSSSKALIEAAKADWRARRFAPVPDETEWIPLPED